MKLPLLVPYFLWKQHLPPPPAAAVLTVRLRQDHRHCCVSYALVKFVRVVAAVPIPSSLPGTTRVPAAAVRSKPAEDFFLNVQQSDNSDRLTLEELSFLLPIFWTKMFL